MFWREARMNLIKVINISRRWCGICCKWVKGKWIRRVTNCCVCSHLVPFLFFCTQYTIELVVCVHHNPLTGYHRSKAGQKGYGKHQQQVRWYIEYKKKKRDQMSTNAKVNYPQESFSLLSFITALASYHNLHLLLHFSIQCASPCP